MTVEDTTNRERYATNGTTGPFTVHFYFLENSHLQVVYTNSAGVETVLTLTTDYSVSGAGDEAGGSVTTVAAYATGGYITIVRDVPITQLTDYTDNDPFPANSHEAALDKLTMIVAQQKEVQDRTLKLPVSSDASSEIELIASYFLAVNATGDGIISSPGSPGAYPTSAFMATVLDDTTAAAARSTLGVAPRATRIDVASVAGTVDLTANAPDTDDIRMTGALAVTGFTIAVGRVVRVVSASTHSLANNANITTQTGATITCAAGDSYMIRATAANTVEIIEFVRAAPVTVGTGLLIGRTYYTCPSQALSSISNASPAVLTVADAQNRPLTGSPIYLTTSGALPTGLSPSTQYWVINSSGTTFNVSATKGGAAINTSSAGSGTHTAANAPYTKATNNPSFVEAEALGAGGGGGGGTAAVNTTCGGAAGGYCKKIILASALGSSETVVTGLAGTAGANTGTDGGAGGNTTFGAFLIANGGAGGKGGTTNIVRPGCAGGTATGGDINLTGNGGYPNFNISSAALPSNGASSVYGSGGAWTGTPAAAQAGADATGFGSGGSGMCGATTTAAVGGKGSMGLVIVSEYA